MILYDNFCGKEKYKFFPENVYIPSPTRKKPIKILNQDRIGWINNNPPVTARPTAPKIIKNPRPNEIEIWKIFKNLITKFDFFTGELEEQGWCQNYELAEEASADGSDLHFYGVLPILLSSINVCLSKFLIE